MKIDLTGKTALVTGSTAGIGFAIARGLAGAGARVVVNGRKDQTVQAARERLLKDLPGARVEGVAADLSTATGCAAVAKAVPDLDILVN
ncbi:MAG TPA: SDR family NAD(P)-dependent oxidoreductase, partial [Dongiaceae bacterium]|nr:SDR family NAD(P)-dependent oxidoreductase [Dongiaceae bacterium]